MAGSNGDAQGSSFRKKLRPPINHLHNLRPRRVLVLGSNCAKIKCSHAGNPTKPALDMSSSPLIGYSAHPELELTFWSCGINSLRRTIHLHLRIRLL